MHTQIFETRVLKEGYLKIPEIKNLVNHKVKVFIFEEKEKEKITVEEFLKKWTGVLKGKNPDRLKFEYLMEKYK